MNTFYLILWGQHHPKTKTDKGITRKVSYRPILLLSIDAKNLKSRLTNKLGLIKIKNVGSVPFNKWMDKYIMVHTYHGILLSDQNKDLSILAKTWRKFKCVMISERSQTEKVTCYKILSIWHYEKHKIMGTVKRSVIARDWGENGERWIGGAQGIIRSVKLFYMML